MSIPAYDGYLSCLLTNEMLRSDPLQLFYICLLHYKERDLLRFDRPFIQ